jgi:hypothetical protein
VSWVEWDGKAWVARRGTVDEDDLTRLQGQNYLAVPECTFAAAHRRLREQGPE